MVFLLKMVLITLKKEFYPPIKTHYQLSEMCSDDVMDMKKKCAFMGMTDQIMPNIRHNYIFQVA
jgi:hypothetical protein